jgi:uncharacterized membrane protein YkoI
MLLASFTRARALVALLMAAGLSLAIASPAETDEDHDGDQHPIEASEAAPLQWLLARIRQDFTATVLQVELENETSGRERRSVYQVKVLTPEGDVLKLEYDAKTLELLTLKGHYEHHRDNGDDKEGP